VRTIAASYGFSRQDIRAAAMAGVNLSSEKSQACREAIMRKEDQTAWFGSPAHGISSGLLNNPNMIEVNLPADGGGGSTDFRTKGTDEIIRDLNAIAAGTFDATFGMETPDTMLITPTLWSLVTTAPRSNTDTTILTFFKTTSPWIKNVDWLNELKGIGAGGNDRIVVFRRDRSRLSQIVPMDYTEYEPQPKGLELVIPAESRTAGTIIKRPLSVAYTDDALVA